MQRNKNHNMDYYGNAFILEFLEIWTQFRIVDWIWISPPYQIS